MRSPSSPPETGWRHVLTSSAPGPMHLSVALDGAGWHPAAWREPGARPAELFTAGYWADLVAEAERGLLDFVTIEDGLGLQSSRRRAGRRTDQVRGRLDAVLIAARVAPLTRHIGLVPTVVVTHTEPFHVSKAIATLDYVSTGPGRASGSGCRPARTRPRTSGGAAVPPLDLRTARPGGPAADRRAVRRGRRLRRGGPAAVGQLGGRRRDPRRRDRPVRRPGQAALHRLRRAATSASRARRSRPRPPQGQPVVAALGHAAVPYRLIAARPPTSASSPRTTPPRPAPSWREIQAPTQEAAAAAGDRCTSSADLVVFLDDDRRRGRGPQGPAGRARRAAFTQRRGRLHRHARAAGRPAAGVAAGRAVRLPAASRRHPRRSRGDHQGPGARTAAPRRVPHVLRGRHAARAARARPPRQPLRRLPRRS